MNLFKKIKKELTRPSKWDKLFPKIFIWSAGSILGVYILIQIIGAL